MLALRPAQLRTGAIQSKALSWALLWGLLAVRLLGLWVRALLQVVVLACWAALEPQERERRGLVQPGRERAFWGPLGLLARLLTLLLPT